MPIELQELTHKERLFVMYYIGVCRFNATRAAIKAGYSEHTAREIASENLSKPHIRAAIDAELRRVAVDYPSLRREVMAEYYKLSFSDITNAADINAILVKIREGGDLPPEVTAAIKKVSMTTTGVTVELHDKRSALADMAKVLSLLSENPPKDGEHYEGMIERLEREAREKETKSHRVKI